MDGQQRAAHGNRRLDLHGSPGWGGVEQPLVTTVGKRYKVTFSMSGNPGLGHLSVQMIVRFHGRELPGHPLPSQIIQRLSLHAALDDVFLPRGPLTVLEFRTAMTAANPFGGPLLDDVQVVAVD